MAWVDRKGRRKLLADFDEAISALWEHLSSVREEGGTAATVKGFPGAGKTMLLDRFVRKARAAGLLTLYASGCPGEEHARLGVVEQLFSGCSGDVAERLAQFVQEYQEAADRCAPGTILRNVQKIVDGELRGHCEMGPVVIVVDDVQFCDEASLEILKFLCNRLRDLELFILMSDSPHLRAICRQFQRAVSRVPRLLVLELDYLTPGAVADLVCHVTGSRPSRRYVKETLKITGGNPLLVTSLARDSNRSENALAKRVPIQGPVFRETVVLMAYGSPEEAQNKVVRALAVLGSVRSVDFISALCEVDPVQALSTLTRLEAARLVADDRFRTHEIRLALLADIGFTGRADLSRAAAKLLYWRGGGTPMEVAELIASTGAVEEEWEIHVLREAARQATAEGKWRESVDLLELAYGFPGSCEKHPALRVELTTALWRLEPRMAARHLRDLVTIARNGRLPAPVLVHLVLMCAWFGHLDEVKTILSLAQAQAGEDWPDLYHQYQDVKRVLELYFQEGPALEGKPLLGDGPETLPPVSSPGLRAIFPSLAIMGRDSVDDSRYVDDALRALFLSDANELLPIDASFLQLWLLYQVSTSHPAMHQIDDVHLVDSRHHPFREMLLSCLQAVSALAQGNFGTAETKARTALEQPENWGVAVGLPLSVLIISLTAQGKKAEAGDVLTVQIGANALESHFGRLYMYARGLYYLATKNPAAALRNFLECGKAELSRGFPPVPSCPWQVCMAHTYLHIEKEKAAAAAQYIIDTVPEDFGPSKALALRVLALTQSPEQRVATLREAVNLMEEHGVSFQLAVTLNDLAYSYYALGSTSSGRALARRAVSMAKSLGIERFFGQGVTEELPEPFWYPAEPSMPETKRRARASEDDRRHLGSGGEDSVALRWAVLTRAEQRVARLAGSGHSNREIASHLFVTVSTVEQHLTRIYRKLGIRHRKDLAVPVPPVPDQRS